jgi:NAD(P)-dependent dehydrogenase (short-subunit alcohol dehydrogenase family)
MQAAEARTSDRGRLAGRVAIVTGAARGIGRAIAEGYAREGAHVIVADRLEPEAEAVVAGIVEAGGRALSVATDVASNAAVDALVERALGLTGRVDVLVNNAGIYDGIRTVGLEELTVEEWDAILTVNVRGTWNGVRAVVPAMRAQGYGKIVNLASGTFLVGTPFNLHYVASKGAVVAMTRAMARELGPDGIRVNSLAPGLTDSGAKKRVEIDPARRQSGPPPALAGGLVPDDIVGTAVFLASADSDAMTGQLVAVNRGTAFTG